MSWDIDVSEKLYQRLANEIFFRILHGKYRTGDKMPSYTELAKEAGSSPETVRKAFRELQHYGVIEKMRRGYFVTDKTTNFKEQLANPFSEQAEEIIKDPYIFDFIPNAKKLRETELEDALVQQITKLLLEFGSGFAFMGRQYPIQVGKREFFIDLLFYNVKLHCYFVVELKTVEFEPEFAGKLSFYLSAVDGELKSPNDNPTIGLLLCKGKDKMVAEYALKDVNKPMGVSEYKLSNHVSEELQDKLPSIEDIEKRIN